MSRRDVKGWLRTEANSKISAVDFGCGDGHNTVGICRATPLVIGIEGFESYLTKFKNGSWHKKSKHKLIHGNILDYRILLKDYELDIAVFIDVLEHLEKEDALKMLKMVKEDFTKILLFIPIGEHDQNSDPYGEGNDLQIHRSRWSVKELEELGFNVELNPDFHKSKGGLPAAFCIWR